MTDIAPGQLTTIPVALQPGINRTSTLAGVGANWFDGHLVRWVQGRLRPIGGWELMDLPPFPSPIRAMHAWIDGLGVTRLAILCETSLWVLEGPDVPGPGDTLRDITPLDGIVGPPNINRGGYGNDLYGAGSLPAPDNFPNIYGSGQRSFREDYRSVGEIWRLANWGDTLIAMASPDGRLLNWEPGPDPVPGTTLNRATAVAGAPVKNRTFVVTAERHVMLFAMGGIPNSFGWCSQEVITDWNFGSSENTAGSYAIEPASRIIDAVAAAYSIIFWTIEGAYTVQYRALPYVYTYSYLGQQAAPLSGQAAVSYSGTVIWPAADGFWRFDGQQIQFLTCPILDWFQQRYDDRTTRAHMAGWFNGAFSEVWWCFPEINSPENDLLIVYNFQERWWSIGYFFRRTCGIPGSSLSYPLMATVDRIYRHEKGYNYAGADMPWVRSGFIGMSDGALMATTKQILVDTDAELGTVAYQLFATKGRFANAPEYTKGAKLPIQRQLIVPDGDVTAQGKIDYRITGRDFAVKMQMVSEKPWTFGKGLITAAPRGRRGGF